MPDIARSSSALSSSGRSVGIWLVRGDFGPLISHLVPFNALVAWEPLDLDFNSWLIRSEGGDVFPGHDRVFDLASSRIVGGHSPDGRLGVREDGDGAKRMVSGCRYSEGPCNCCAFCVVGFLATAHVGFVAFPGIALLPGDRVASCAILQFGAVREDGQSRSARKLCFSHGCGFYCYGGGCLKGFCNLK